jgi:hypothetical protein
VPPAVGRVNHFGHIFRLYFNQSFLSYKNYLKIITFQSDFKLNFESLQYTNATYCVFLCPTLPNHAP